jgi:MFS family permease
MTLRILFDIGRRHHCRIPSIIVVRSSSGVSSLIKGMGKRSLSTSSSIISSPHYNIEFDQQRTINNLLNLVEFTTDEFDTRFECILLAGTNSDDSEEWRKKRRKRRRWETTARSSSWRSPILSSSLPTSNYINDETTMTSHDLEAYLLNEYRNIEVTSESSLWNRHHRRCRKSLLTMQKQNPIQRKQQKQQKWLINERMIHCARKDAKFLHQLLRSQHNKYEKPSSSTSTSSITTNTTCITRRQFRESLHTMSSKVHYPLLLPLSVSMLLTGLSVGVTSPIMPFISDALQLTTTQYGTVISSFAVSKMLLNVPSSILVDRYGRRPYLVHSLWFIGLGVGGMGIATDAIQLCLCRMIVGAGVAALTTASSLMVADISTPQSRASTYSPIMSAFALGMTLGPGLGGLLHDTYGVRDTFFIVGGMYGVAATWNHYSVKETMTSSSSSSSSSKTETDGWQRNELLPWHRDDWDGGFIAPGIIVINDKTTLEKTSHVMEEQTEESNNNLSNAITLAVKDTTEQWKVLLANIHVRPVIIMNGFYMLTLSGTQFTLLPLILTGGGEVVTTTAVGFALSSSEVGQLYMWMSAVQVLGNQAAGRFADTAGKGSAIILGGALTSFGMAGVPIVCTYFSTSGDAINIDWAILAASLGIWSLGGTLLSTSHVAAVSDLVGSNHRSQALALLRTAGDVGYLCGAIGAGLLADGFGDVGLAMQTGGAVLIGSTVWFAVRSTLR